MAGAGGTSGGVPDFSLPEQRMEQRHVITAATGTLQPEKIQCEGRRPEQVCSSA